MELNNHLDYIRLGSIEKDLVSVLKQHFLATMDSLSTDRRQTSITQSVLKRSGQNLGDRIDKVAKRGIC